MKKLFVFFVGFALMLYACKPSTEEIIDFNDKIIKQQIAIIKSENKFIESFNSNDPQTVQQQYEIFVKQIESSIDSIEKLEELDEEVKLKQAALDLFTTYRKVAKEDYGAVVEIYQLPDTLYTQEHEMEIANYSSKIDSILTQEVDAFLIIQKKFADKNEIVLTDSSSNN